MLSMFLGLLGADQCYLGFWRAAVLMLATLGGFGLWLASDLPHSVSYHLDCLLALHCLHHRWFASCCVSGAFMARVGITVE